MSYFCTVHGAAKNVPRRKLQFPRHRLPFQCEIVNDCCKGYAVKVKVKILFKKNSFSCLEMEKLYKKLQKLYSVF